MYDLSAKTVLVTGASKGIGAAIASHIGSAGAHVIAQYGSDRNGAQAAVSDIDASRVRLVQCDMSSLPEVEALWDQAVGWRGRVDVLINNAAMMRFDGGVAEPLERWDQVWEQTLAVNLLAPARLLRRAVRHYLEHGGGIIVTISSWAAQKGVSNPDAIAYGSSKAAIHNATQTIARAYAADGILAYLVAPGVVRTRLSDQAAKSVGGEAAVTAGLAMKEWVPPEDIARIAVFLASGAARHLTGATLDVNGASYIR
ncbi:MAG: SDR family oxidoreductase [Gammaproteobacteria bacterium]|nr:SDR family oxidoreductase [Gammaproteobacteria bacterium]MDH5309536.1 SDR family oxidoreductase [Gammaproteobacteria bacterium]